MTGLMIGLDWIRLLIGLDWIDDWIGLDQIADCIVMMIVLMIGLDCIDVIDWCTLTRSTCTS